MLQKKDESSDSEDDSEADSEDKSDESEDEKPAPKKRKAEADVETETKKAKIDTEGDAETGPNGETTTLFVGRVSWATDDDALYQEFSSFGEIVGCRIVYERDTGRSKG
jgi:nucleolin